MRCATSIPKICARHHAFAFGLPFFKPRQPWCNFAESVQYTTAPVSLSMPPRQNIPEVVSSSKYFLHILFSRRCTSVRHNSAFVSLLTSIIGCSDGENFTTLKRYARLKDCRIDGWPGPLRESICSATDKRSLRAVSAFSLYMAHETLYQMCSVRKRRQSAIFG